MDKHQAIINTEALPVTIQLEHLTPEEFINYYKTNRESLEDLMACHGAIKFCNVEVSAMEHFKQITHAISDNFLQYVDGNSPRTKLADAVYTSTEYDKTQKITMHNELSYSWKWPGRLFFTCLQTATTGGETLLVDGRKVLEHMDSELVNTIEQKGLIYIRNLHGGVGMGPSWQDTFETDSRKEVEQYCSEYEIDFEWKDDDALTLKQRSPGIIKHHRTGDKVWFNQIDQFHPVQLGTEYYEVLKSLYNEPENFPTYVTYGDGTAIQEEIVGEILKTIESLTVYPNWNLNEILVVDNELVAHGRNMFTGDRKVLVSMSA